MLRAGDARRDARASASTHTTSSSFACDLRKWLQIMEAYENGGHAYHATMPTDALAQAARRDAGDRSATASTSCAPSSRNWATGCVRCSAQRGIHSVAAPGFEAPGRGRQLHRRSRRSRTARSLPRLGLQIAAGVPLQCDEPADFRTFRIGLFGLDKLHNVDRTVATLAAALEQVQG